MKEIINSCQTIVENYLSTFRYNNINFLLEFMSKNNSQSVLHLKENNNLINILLLKIDYLKKDKYVKKILENSFFNINQNFNSPLFIYFFFEETDKDIICVLNTLKMINKIDINQKNVVFVEIINFNDNNNNIFIQDENLIEKNIFVIYKKV